MYKLNESGFEYLQNYRTMSHGVRIGDPIIVLEDMGGSLRLQLSNGRIFHVMREQVDILGQLPLPFSSPVKGV